MAAVTTERIHEDHRTARRHAGTQASSSSERTDPRDHLAARPPDRSAHGRGGGPARLGYAAQRAHVRRRPPLYPPSRADPARCMARRPSPGCRPPTSPSGDRGDAPTQRRRRPSLVATRGTCALIRLRHPSGHPDLSLEPGAFRRKAAWLACLLATVNPVVADIVVNVLSESTFLLWWTFGLWCAVRFLREGRFLWLPAVIGLGGLAYLTRPEGMLLPVALAATLLISPLFPATRIEWPRWWRALAFLAAGLVVMVGPYIAIKGGVGTKPGIARVLGLRPRHSPWVWSAVSRSRPTSRPTRPTAWRRSA